MRTPGYVLVLVVGLCSLSGCDSPPSPLPVSGMVTSSRKMKTDNLLLQFHPLSKPVSGKLLGGSAITDADGKFTVKREDGTTGLSPGNYIVIIIDNNLNVEEEPGKSMKIPRNRVPMKYMQSDEKNNPLKISVQAGASDFPLVMD
ncbi:MAG: hypothetical protein ACRC8S_14700 [Fimbriiglobus sp.]